MARTIARTAKVQGDDSDQPTTTRSSSRRRSVAKKAPVQTSESDAQSDEEVISSRPHAKPVEKDSTLVQAPALLTPIISDRKSKVEQVFNQKGAIVTRTTTTVTTIIVEEAAAEEPTKSFPNTESTPIYRRASLYRSFVAADWITMLNAVMGVCSILFCLNYLANDQEDYYLFYAFVCLPLALLFDISDGWVARKQGKHSPWGSDLDSLSDCISFTLCPTALAFTCGFRSFWDCLALCFLTFCGISRLARFNVTSQTATPGKKVPYYEGFPVPSSLGIDAILFWFWYTDRIGDKLPLGTITLLGKELHLLSFLFIAWGCLFVSASIRIPKP